MRSRAVFRVLFVIYCVEAGVFLMLIPWSNLWERHLLELPFVGLRTFALHPMLRGAVTGFGIVHLIWGVHDLELLLGRWFRWSRPKRPSDL